MSIPAWYKTRGRVLVLWKYVVEQQLYFQQYGHRPAMFFWCHADMHHVINWLIFRILTSSYSDVLNGLYS